MVKTIKNVVIYARISVSIEESVSITRQVDAATKLAEARGWRVVGVYVDDGVSASHIKPENRPGWRQVIQHEGAYDAVVVWKIDRLARRVLDFLHADESLQRRGAGIVAVEDPVDMTTPQGRAFTVMLSVFAEMEAEAISARVTAARNALIRAGRVVGGTVPYGWRSMPNPEGAGLVLVPDPERVVWVRAMADRVLSGETVYAVTKWLNAENAPLPTTSQQGRRRAGWAYTTVERLLRNPVLAGMTPYNPGRGKHDRADPTAVLRDEAGLPVVDESIAIISTEERRRLLRTLDCRDSPQARPRASKGSTSPLLSRLVTCDECGVLMHRGTIQGRPMVSCPRCHQTISGLAEHLSMRLLQERGMKPFLQFAHSLADGPARTGDLDQAIRETAAEMIHDGADVAALTARLIGLKEVRADALRARPGPQVWQVTNETVTHAWNSRTTDQARREVLISQAQSIRVRRGRRGRGFDPTRVQIQWRKDTSYAVAHLQPEARAFQDSVKGTLGVMRKQPSRRDSSAGSTGA